MIRPLDRDTRGPARGSNAGSAPGPSRRITAASDTHLRPSRFRKDALTVHVTNHTKSRAPKTSPVLRSRRVALAFVPPGALSHTSHRLRFPGWVRELGHELALRRHRGGRAPRTAGNGGGTRRRPRRRRRRSRRFVSPSARARARPRARLVHAALRASYARTSQPALPSRPRGASRDARARGRRTRPPRRRRRRLARAAEVRGERVPRTCGYSVHASTHATLAAAPEPSLPSASSSAAPTYSVQRAMSPSRPARPDSWYRPQLRAGPSARPSTLGLSTPMPNATVATTACRSPRTSRAARARGPRATCPRGTTPRPCLRRRAGPPRGRTRPACARTRCPPGRRPARPCLFPRAVFHRPRGERDEGSHRGGLGRRGKEAAVSSASRRTTSYRRLGRFTGRRTTTLRGGGRSPSAERGALHSGVAVAVSAAIGTSGMSASRVGASARYAGRKSCPHCATQCASSTATETSDPSAARRASARELRGAGERSGVTNSRRRPGPPCRAACSGRARRAPAEPGPPRSARRRRRRRACRTRGAGR